VEEGTGVGTLTQVRRGIRKDRWLYLDNQEWLDNVTSGDYQKYYDNMYKNR
jgi:dTDP-glucose 4,6-dehydratase